MKPMRSGASAALAAAVGPASANVGSICSRSGSATHAPRPRSTVRREIRTSFMVVSPQNSKSEIRNPKAFLVSSFPNSVWERCGEKLRFESRYRRETEFRGGRSQTEFGNEESLVWFILHPSSFILHPSSLLPSPSLLERLALVDFQHQTRKLGLPLPHVPRDLINRTFVVPFHAAAQGVGQHLLGQAVGERGIALLEDRPQLRRAVERLSAGQHARGVDVLVSLFRAPGADRVEVLEAEAQRVHALMAGRTVGVG